MLSAGLAVQRIHFDVAEEPRKPSPNGLHSFRGLTSCVVAPIRVAQIIENNTKGGI